MEENKSIGIWIRVSTEDQAKGDSPEHHEERARMYCKLKGWDVVTVYHLEAISGKSVMDQPEAQRMLKDVREGRIKALVFSKLARLARNTKELLTFADYFQDHKADLVSLQESIDTSTPAGRLFYTIIAAMAQWEREEIASRVAASVPIRAKLGKPLGGAAPYGYTWGDDPLKKQLEIDENEAPVRKLMYEIFLRTKRKKTTAKELNDLGYRTRKGEMFSDTTIDRLLRDPMAKGVRRANYTKSRGNKKHWDLKPSDEWVLIECPSLISEDLWNQCNSILDQQYKKRNKSGRQSNFLLAGILKCKCDNKMYVYHGVDTFHCKNCGNKISVKDIDFIYEEQLKNFLFTNLEIDTYRQETKALIEEKTSLVEVTEMEIGELRNKTHELLQMRMKKEISQEDFAYYYQPEKNRLEELQHQLAELQGEIDVLTIHLASSDTILTDAKDLYSRWADLELHEKRSIVETITDEIVVGEDDIHLKLAYLPKHTFFDDSGKRQHNVRGSWRR
ncbi:recombinase family protein [Chitinophaga silvisoli]|uniref:Recombinase family protein n=1 Tax=Chitinophaga silvisoli TaxID=2291814 RepID=A0A3E1P2H6_9BACT|nr:recombinase family protein [Chitinophaga silvisoli]RFM34403.1 recombinase family protein [Chitinophaga silvisoli]